MQLRLEFAHSSGSKLKKLLASTSADGRARGCFAWHGAHTGRWAGRGSQPQNFPPSGAVEDVEATLAALLRPGGPIDSDNGMSVKARISACLRATIAAPAGYQLVVADLAQIESRVLCWLAGQQNMLETYRRGDDPYVTTAKALGSSDRQFGKLLTLAAGFGGGAKMLMQKAPGYGVTLSPAGSGTRDLRLACREPSHHQVLDVSARRDDRDRRGAARAGTPRPPSRRVPHRRRHAAHQAAERAGFDLSPAPHGAEPRTTMTGWSSSTSRSKRATGG